MRTSAGFCDTGLSGKIRIQMRPPRLIARDMARRAASIWRAVSRPRVVALSPYSPKLTLLPRVAIPRLRPFCSLRYLRLAGCSILRSCLARARALARRARLLRPVGGRRFGLRRRFLDRARDLGGDGRGRLLALLDDLALEYPDLDADCTGAGLRCRDAVVDLGAQGVQRHAPFPVPLVARDLDAVEPARAGDLDALRAEAHRVGDGTFHGAAEHDALLQLLGDRVGDQLRVDLGLADFLDIDVHRYAQHLLQLGLERLDVLAFLADDDAGARAVHRDAGILCRPFNDDLRDRRVRQLLLEKLADLQILEQHAGEVPAVGVPLRRPVAVQREAEPDRVDFLTHALLSPVADGDENVAGRLHDLRAATLGLRAEAAQERAALDADVRYFQLVDVRAVVVLGVGDRRLEELPQDDRALLRAELQDVQRLVDRFAAYLVRHQPALLGREAHAAELGRGVHVLSLRFRRGGRGRRRRSSRGRRRRRRLAVAARGRGSGRRGGLRRARLGVSLEDAGVGELAELVADHVLRHVHRHVLLAVVHGDREPDKIRQDGRAARPGLDRPLVVE